MPYWGKGEQNENRSAVKVWRGGRGCIEAALYVYGAGRGCIVVAYNPQVTE